MSLCFQFKIKQDELEGIQTQKLKCIATDQLFYDFLLKLSNMKTSQIINKTE